MKTTYALFLKSLREARGLSQVDVANVSGMSRASYVAVEKGTKELSLSEADSLTKLFGITLHDLVTVTAPNLKIYQEMMLYFIRQAKLSKTTIKKTKLASLLYLADFSWYFTHDTSLSGLAYRKINFGPVADEYFRLLEEMEQEGIINVKQIYRDDYHMYELEETRASAKKVLSHVSKKEQTHLDKIWTQWEKASTAEITHFVSQQNPSKESLAGEIIKYEHIKTEDSYNLY